MNGSGSFTASGARRELRFPFSFRGESPGTNTSSVARAIAALTLCSGSVRVAGGDFLRAAFLALGALAAFLALGALAAFLGSVALAALPDPGDVEPRTGRR